MKIIFTDYGCTPPVDYEITTPFEKADMTKELLEEFRQSIVNLYKKYSANGGGYAEYDFEIADALLELEEESVNPYYPSCRYD